MTPEEQARQEIDRQLEDCGWTVQDFREINISAAPGVAVREFPLGREEADYLLYAAGKALGVVEAKPRGHTLAGVESQSARYVHALPAGVPAHRLPLPFLVEFRARRWSAERPRSQLALRSRLHSRAP